MSVTISRNLSVSKTYDNLGITVPSDTETKDVIYTATDIISDDGETAYVRFTVQISGIDTTNQTIFAYETNGVSATLVIAESSLESSLKG